MPLDQTDDVQTLYVMRPVINAAEIVEWAKGQGFTTVLEPDDMHVTVAFSSVPVSWDSVPDASQGVTVANDERAVRQFDGGAVVLEINSATLADRWAQLLDLGASWDFASYRPHITLTYNAPADLDLLTVKPFEGTILLGSEEFAPVTEGYGDDLVEKLGAPLRKVRAPLPEVERRHAAHRAELAKRGARHTRTEYGQLQVIHDHAVALGARCHGHDDERGLLDEAGAIVGKRGDIAVAKVDDSLGLVFGWAIICKQAGADYFDTQGDHISEDAMLNATAKFMAEGRVHKIMHAGEQVGTIVFGFPVTGEIGKAMGLTSGQTGFMIAAKPASADIMGKYRSGEYTGFSIGGNRVRDEDV